MDVSKMRDHISKMYPGDSWKHKVANMRDNQVMAVYFSMKKKGQEPIKENKKERQLTLSDIYGGKGC